MNAAALGGAIALAAGAAVAAAAGPLDGFGRGVFAFGPAVVDVGRGQEYYCCGGPVGSPVEVCTNADYYCLYAPHGDGWVSAALPRACRAIKVGDDWSVGPVRTEVIAAFESNPGVVDLPLPEGGPSGRGWLLGDPQRRGVAYVYDHWAGLYAFYWDPEGKTDVYALAKAGRLNPFDLNAEAQTLRPRLYFKLVTPDAMGACRH